MDILKYTLIGLLFLVWAVDLVFAIRFTVSHIGLMTAKNRLTTEAKNNPIFHEQLTEVKLTEVKLTDYIYFLQPLQRFVLLIQSIEPQDSESFKKLKVRCQIAYEQWTKCFRQFLLISVVASIMTVILVFFAVIVDAFV